MFSRSFKNCMGKMLVISLFQLVARIISHMFVPSFLLSTMRLVASSINGRYYACLLHTRVSIVRNAHTRTYFVRSPDRYTLEILLET